MIYWPLFWHWVLIIIVIIMIIGLIYACADDDFALVIALDAFFDMLSDIFDSFNDPW